MDWVVLGVGMNENNTVSGLEGDASLKSLTGRAWEPAAVLRSFLKSFARKYHAFQ